MSRGNASSGVCLFGLALRIGHKTSNKMVKAALSGLAFFSILYDVLSVLFGHFQTSNRATGFEVFLDPHLTQKSKTLP
jgi:hypothetical protein